MDINDIPRIFESLALLSSIDGYHPSERKLLLDFLGKFYDGDTTTFEGYLDQNLDEISAVKEKEKKFYENIVILSETLSQEEKIEFEKLLEQMILADREYTKEEKQLYLFARENLQTGRAEPEELSNLEQTQSAPSPRLRLKRDDFQGEQVSHHAGPQTIDSERPVEAESQPGLHLQPTAESFKKTIVGESADESKSHSPIENKKHNRVKSTKKKFRFRLRWVFLALTILSLTGFGTQLSPWIHQFLANRDVIAYLDVKSDVVLVQRAGNVHYVEEFAFALKPGDLIKTEQRGKVAIVMENGDKIFMGPSTSLELDRTKIGQFSASRHLSLLYGKIRAKIKKRPIDQLKIITTTATIGVRGTEFIVKHESGHTTIGTLEGLVYLNALNTDKSLDIPPGTMAKAELDGHLSTLEKLEPGMLKNIDFTTDLDPADFKKDLLDMKDIEARFKELLDRLKAKADTKSSVNPAPTMTRPKSQANRAATNLSEEKWVKEYSEYSKQQNQTAEKFMNPEDTIKDLSNEMKNKLAGSTEGVMKQLDSFKNEMLEKLKELGVYGSEKSEKEKERIPAK
ncbi:FecR family protein [Deltaproteobacteria bacterium TL4]